MSQQLTQLHETILYDYAALAIIFNEDAMAVIHKRYEEAQPLSKNQLHKDFFTNFTALPFEQRHYFKELVYVISAAYQEDEVAWHAQIQKILDQALKKGYRAIYKFLLSQNRFEAKFEEYTNKLAPTTDSFAFDLYTCLYLYVASTKGYFYEAVDLTSINNRYKGNIEAYFEGRKQIGIEKITADLFVKDMVAPKYPKTTDHTLYFFGKRMGEEGLLLFDHFEAATSIPASTVCEWLKTKKQPAQVTIFGNVVRGALYSVQLTLEDLTFMMYATKALHHKVKAKHLQRAVMDFACYSAQRKSVSTFEAIEFQAEVAEVDTSAYEEKIRTLDLQLTKVRDAETIAQQKLQQAQAEISRLQKQVKTLEVEPEPASEPVQAPVTVAPAEVDATRLNELNVCIVGGHPNFHRRILDAFPNVTIWQSRDYKNTNTAQLDKQDVIAFISSYNNHGQFKRVRSHLAKTKQKDKLLMINRQPAPQAFAELVLEHYDETRWINN